MQQHVIDSAGHHLYGEFKSLYDVSFPVFELRSSAQQEAAFADRHYRLFAFTDAGVFVGFISCWMFQEYCYVEHFAVSAALRGKGYGSRLLNSFVEAAPDIVVLEIDPVVDDVAEARWRFYKRCGFHQNPYPHRHPAYDSAFQPHPLVVLSSGRQVSEEEYARFRDDLDNVVMA